MKRAVAFAMGAVALGWLAGPLTAGDTLYSSLTVAADVEKTDAKPMPSKPEAPPSAAKSETPRALPAMAGVEGTTYGTAVMDGSSGDADNDSGHLFAAGGIYGFVPHIQNNPAYFTAVSSVVGPALFQVFNNSQTSFDHDLEVGPRVWLGYVDPSGLGVRARYWYLEADQSISVSNNTPVTTSAVQLRSASPFFGIPGFTAAIPGSVTDQVVANFGTDLFLHNELKFHVVDAEAFQEFKLCSWLLTGSGGVRYAHLDQQYNAFNAVRFTPPGPMPMPDVLNSSNKIDGVGPTVALEGRRPIGCSGFALYAMGRGSLLCSERRLHADFFCEFTQTFDSHEDMVLPIAEVELGGEWCHSFDCFSAYIHAAWVEQAWFGTGSATNQNGNLGLCGFTVMAGICF